MLFLILTSCTNRYAWESTCPENEREEIKTSISSFIQIIEKADPVEFLEIVDPEYKSVQLDGFLQGRTEQFLNEFFCGEIYSDGDFRCINFSTIKKCQLNFSDQTAPGFVTLELKIQDHEGIVICEVLMKKNGDKYYLSSALG